MNDKKRNSLLFAMLTVIAFSINKKVIYDNFKNVMHILQLNIFFVVIFTIVLYFFYLKVSKKKLHPLKKILAICFAIFLLIGNSYEQIGSWDLVFSNLSLFLISIFQGTCYYIFFYYVFSLLDSLLKKSKRKKIKIKNSYLNRLIKIFQNHPFLICFLIILICWVIYIIAFYPLILSKDPSFQIKQFFNVKTKYIDYVIPLDENVNLTAHHPILHTLLLGGFIKLGRFLGSDNLGLFFYAMFQTIILASALSCTITYLFKKKGRLRYCFLLLIIYALTPMFPFYAMSAVKDTIYTSFIIFYILFLLKLIESKEQKITWKFFLLFLLDIILIMQFRNNGLYVILLSFPFLLFYRKKQIISLGIIFLLAIASNSLYNHVILPYFKIPAGSIREALSIPFQQTARYVREHAEEITTEEKEIIDKVLGYDDIAERYDPILADPVKNNYNKYTTQEELKDYFKIWLKQGLKHPTTYIEATLNNTYGYFYPNTSNWYIYCGKDYNTLITEDNLVDYHYNSLSGLRSFLSNYGKSFPYIPILGLLCNIGFQGWLLLLSSVYILCSTKRKYFIMLTPLLVSFLICFVSPANTYFRYAMPYIFMMPFILCYIKKVLE